MGPKDLIPGTLYTCVANDGDKDVFLFDGILNENEVDDGGYDDLQLGCKELYVRFSELVDLETGGKEVGMEDLTQHGKPYVVWEDLAHQDHYLKLRVSNQEEIDLIKSNFPELIFNNSSSYSIW